jgi:3-oxoacyl-[acyl-carrier protein] reductase/pteridine reductase
MNSLHGKVTVVTGAAKRTGRSIAIELARRGARVAIHYHDSHDEAVATATECGGRTFRADLCHVDEIRALFGEIERSYGRLDALVNNAAVFRAVDPLEATEEDWDAIHAVNLKGTFFCCQQAARLMLRTGGGRIVNISSLGGLRPWTKHVPYCASKAGVVMLTRGLAKALAPDIAVNSIAPGVIHFGKEMAPDIAHLVRVTPMRRHGTGQEIAEAVRLVLEGPSFMTGQIIAIDGGLSLK